MSDSTAARPRATLYVCVGEDGARVRCDASFESSLLGEIPRGAVVKLVTEREIYRADGRKVRRALVDWRGRRGWVSGGFFEVVDASLRDRAATELKGPTKAGLPSTFPDLPRGRASESSPVGAALVSVVAPTTPSRRWTHENLYESFCRQTYAPLELVVYETGGASGSDYWAPTRGRKRVLRGMCLPPQSGFKSDHHESDEAHLDVEP